MTIIIIIPFDVKHEMILRRVNIELRYYILSVDYIIVTGAWWIYGNIELFQLFYDYCFTKT